MIIVGLDMATKVGYAILENGTLLDRGLVRADAKDKNIAQCDWIEDYGFFVEAKSIARNIMAAIPKDFDFVYIEQTNQGINRTTQKQLEFIHFAVLDSFDSAGQRDKVRYVNSSIWRSTLKITMNKDDRKHNKMVKSGEARGKITAKHLAVRWANATYDLQLKQKDNDIADALAVATYGNTYEKRCKPSVTASDIEKIFEKT